MSSWYYYIILSLLLFGANVINTIPYTNGKNFRKTVKLDRRQLYSQPSQNPFGAVGFNNFGGISSIGISPSISTGISTSGSSASSTSSSSAFSQSGVTAMTTLTAALLQASKQAVWNDLQVYTSQVQQWASENTSAIEQQQVAAEQQAWANINTSQISTQLNATPQVFST